MLDTSIVIGFSSSKLQIKCLRHSTSSGNCSDLPTNSILSFPPENFINKEICIERKISVRSARQSQQKLNRKYFIRTKLVKENGCMMEKFFHLKLNLWELRHQNSLSWLYPSSFGRVFKRHRIFRVEFCMACDFMQNQFSGKTSIIPPHRHHLFLPVSSFKPVWVDVA